MSETLELVDYAVKNLRAGKTPGQVKQQILAASVGWTIVEVNRALVTAIAQLQADQAQPEPRAIASEVIEESPAIDLTTVSAVDSAESVSEDEIQQKLNLVQGSPEFEQRPQFSYAFPRDLVALDTSHSWPVFTVVVLGIALLLVMVILLFQL